MTIKTLEVIHKHLRDDVKRTDAEYKEALGAVHEYDAKGEIVPDELTMRVHQTRKAKDRARGALIEFETQDFR